MGAAYAGGAQERPQPSPPHLRQEPAQTLAGALDLRPLERVNRVIGRRSYLVGIYPNVAALIRLAGALLVKQNGRVARGPALPLGGITAAAARRVPAYGPGGGGAAGGSSKSRRWSYTHNLGLDLPTLLDSSRVRQVLASAR